MDMHETGASGHALVNFLLARPGVVASLGGFEELLRRRYIMEGEFYVQPGHECRPIVDGQGRVGYFIVSDTSRARLLEHAGAAYSSLSMTDTAGTNLLFVPGAAELLG